MFKGVWMAYSDELITLITFPCSHFIPSKASENISKTSTSMAEMSCWHQRFCLPTLNGSNFPITYSIWVNNSLESYYTIVLKYYAFDQLSSNIFADISNVLSICRSLKKLRNEGSTMFRLTAVQILKKNCFVSKNLNNHAEIMRPSTENE